MPSVPKYSSPTVQTADLPNVRVSADAPQAAFGVGLNDATGKAISGAGNALREYAVQEMEEAIKQQTKEGANLFDAGLNDYTVGKDGFQNIRGKDALGVTESYQEKAQKLAKDIESKLTNDRAKEYFRDYTSRALVDFKKQTDSHSLHEYDKFQNEQFKVIDETQRTKAALNFSNPKVVQEAILKQIENADSYARRNGLDSNIEQQKVVSGTRQEIVKQMVLGGNALAAEAYFNKHKNDFFGDDATKTQAFLVEATRAQKAKSIADQIYLKEGYTSIPAAYERIKSIGDDKLQDAVMSEIKTRAAIEEAQEKDNHSLKTQNILKALESGKTLNDLYSDGVVGSLTPKERKAFSTIQQIYSGAAQEKPDPEVYADIIQKSPYELSRMSMGDLILEARPHVTGGQWEQIKERWSNAQYVKDNDPSKRNAYLGEQNADETIFRSMRTAKLAGLDEYSEKATSSKQKELFVKFKDEYNDAALMWSKQNNGKKPDADTMNKIANGIVFKHSATATLKGTFFGYNEKPIGELSDEEKKNVVVPFDKIPEDKIKGMVNILYNSNQLKGMTKDQAIGILKNKNSSIGNSLRARMEKAYGQEKLGNYSLVKAKLRGE